MIRGRLKRAQFALHLAVLFAPLIAFSIAGYLRFGTRALPRYNSDTDPLAYFGLLLLSTVLWSIAVDHYKLAAVELHLQSASIAGRVFMACAATYVGILTVTFFYRATLFSRMFIWMSALVVFLFTAFALQAFRWIWLRWWPGRYVFSQVLIVGVDEFAARVAESLKTCPVAPCVIKGHVRLGGQSCCVKDLPVYELSDIDKLAIGNEIDDVVLALRPGMLSDIEEIRSRLSPLCVPVRLVLSVGESADSHHRLFTLGNVLMLDLHETPAESALYIVLKRAFDVIFSACVLLFAAPVFLLIALAVRLSSPGPIFFAQERVGLNGKLFRMYKFRTMTVTPRSESDNRWTVRDDPRCTGIGRILRQLGFDELPQFFNVLKGEMSVVGPRPERPALVQRFMHSVGNYNRRHYLKVGITGWAQVNGWRGDTSIEKRVEFDLYYVRHWTLGFDLLIVALTLIRGFTDKNAY